VKFRYGLDDIPPLSETILFGLQWLAISIPGIVILGNIVGGLHFTDPSDQIIYLQKLFFVTGVTLFFQVLWGHRLPLIAGPSTVLVIGVIASRGHGLNTIYGSVAIGGAFLFLVGAAGLFGHIRKLFTPRVIAALLLLIAATLTPTIIKLLTHVARGASIPGRLLFAAVLIVVMFALYRHLKGIWKSTVIVWSMAGASVAYHLLFRPVRETADSAAPALVSPFFHNLTTGFSFEPGVLISFLFCFFALSVNDVASIQSISEMLKPEHPEGRLNRGIICTGLANLLSGFLGVIGPVNFSLSPGIIMASGSASRFSLIPAAVGLLLLSFSPLIVGLIGSIPPVVTGAMLLYILCYQVAAGLIVAIGPGKEFSLESGLIVGLPLLLGIIFSFLPENVICSFPPLLRPLIGNGFVVGVLASLVMEHIVFTTSSDRS
jgi:xanthine/uracil permease